MEFSEYLGRCWGNGRQCSKSGFTLSVFIGMQQIKVFTVLMYHPCHHKNLFKKLGHAHSTMNFNFLLFCVTLILYTVGNL